MQLRGKKEAKCEKNDEISSQSEISRSNLTLLSKNKNNDNFNRELNFNKVKF